MLYNEPINEKSLTYKAESMENKKGRRFYLRPFSLIKLLHQFTNIIGIANGVFNG